LEDLWEDGQYLLGLFGPNLLLGSGHVLEGNLEAGWVHQEYWKELRCPLSVDGDQLPLPVDCLVESLLLIFINKTIM
jgi:hypothetical protein